MNDIHLVWPQPLQLPKASKQQLAILQQWASPLLVLGAPGTGKTTLVALAAVESVKAGRKPLVIARSRQAASQLRNLIAAGLAGQAWLPQVTTMHALCRSLLTSESRLLSAPEQESRLRELLLGSVATWPKSLQAAVTTRVFARQVRDVLATSRQLGLDPRDVERFGHEADSTLWEAVGRFFAEYLDVLDAEGVIDYAEAVHRARLVLSDPEELMAVRNQIDEIVVDDYPELDLSQLSLLAQLGCSRLLALGDPYSVITEFRGAYLRAVADFPQIFGQAAQVALLSVGFRQPTALSTALAGIRSQLPVPVVLGQARQVAAQARKECAGSVRAFECASPLTQGNDIAELIHELRLEGFDFSQIAVIARSDQAQILHALTAARIPTKVAAVDIGLSQAHCVQVLLAALRLAVQEPNPVDLQLVLLSGLGGLDQLGLREVLSQFKAISAADSDSASNSDFNSEQLLLAAFCDPSWIPANPSVTAVARFAELVNLISAARSALEKGTSAAEVAWKIWSGSHWPQTLSQAARPGSLQPSGAGTQLAAIRTFFAMAQDGDCKGGLAGVRSLQAQVEALQIPADYERESRAANNEVELATVHRAKGRQWPVVIVAGVDAASWPVTWHHPRLLDSRALSVRGIVPFVDSDLMAERRAFYAACACAEKELIVVSGGEPSRFVAELGIEPVPFANKKLPASQTKFVGELRRIATDASSSTPLRQAAARVLATLPKGDPSSWWGVRQVSSPKALAATPITISPSQLSELLECPRRYFLRRSGHADRPLGSAAAFGSIIHALAERLQHETLSAAQIKSYLGEEFTKVEFPARWQMLSERDAALAAVKRLQRWLTERDHVELVGVEIRFSTQLQIDSEEVIVNGSVDRLERLKDGRLQIIDFKTGLQMPTKEQISGSEQLGLYQLAIQAGAFASGNIPAGASLVYLRLGDEYPKQYDQLALNVKPHLKDGSGEDGYPTWVHHRLAQAVSIVKDGSFPATTCKTCRTCTFAMSCPALGHGGLVNDD